MLLSLAVLLACVIGRVETCGIVFALSSQRHISPPVSVLLTTLANAFWVRIAGMLLLQSMSGDRT